MTSDPFNQNTKANRTLNQILDAAMRCYERNGIAKTQLDEVAKEAGVSRTTLYRYVRNHEDLFNQVLKRDAEERIREREIALQYHDNLADILVDGAMFNMRGRKHRPMFKLLFSEDSLPSPGIGSLSPDNFRETSKALMQKHFIAEQEKGRIQDGMTLDMAVEFICRLQLSLMAFPEPFLDDEKALRQFLEATLLPPIIKS